MKIRITYRDDFQPTEYKNVGTIKIISPGVYHITNQNGDMIAQIPMDVVRMIEDPNGDSPIVQV